MLKISLEKLYTLEYNVQKFNINNIGLQTKIYNKRNKRETKINFWNYM